MGAPSTGQAAGRGATNSTARVAAEGARRRAGTPLVPVPAQGATADAQGRSTAAVAGEPRRAPGGDEPADAASALVPRGPHSRAAPRPRLRAARERHVAWCHHRAWRGGARRGAGGGAQAAGREAGGGAEEPRVAREPARPRRRGAAPARRLPHATLPAALHREDHGGARRLLPAARRRS